MVECDICDEEAKKEFTCDYCKKSKYCGSDCKILGTRSHKNCQTPGSLRSVDYLYINVYHNELPTNEQTIKDYGFLNCKREEDWQNLLGLYIGVLKVFEIPRDVLHEYCMKDEIAVVIKKKFDEHPINSRGGYYPWFLQNQYMVKNGRRSNETSAKLKIRPKSSAKFAIQDGAHIINYGFNADTECYYLNVQDPRLAWRSGLNDNVEKVTNEIDNSGEGIVLQLHTCSLTTIRGHQVSVETLAEFYKRYGIRNAHIEKMKQNKQL